MRLNEWSIEAGVAEIRPSEIRAIELAAPAVHRIPFGCETPQTRMGKIGFGKVTQITGSIAHLASMPTRAGEINAIKTRVVQNSLAQIRFAYINVIETAVRNPSQASP